MARGNKNTHKREIRALVKAEHYLDEIVIAMIIFSNRKTEGHFCAIRDHLHGLREEINNCVCEQEAQLKKASDIVNTEVSRSYNNVEQMVKRHPI